MQTASSSPEPLVPVSEPAEVVPEAAPARSHRWARVGVILMGASLPLWPALLAVPFLPLSLAAQGAVVTGIIVVAEVAFWGGAALAGPEAARRMRSWWRRRPARQESAPYNGADSSRTGLGAERSGR